MTSVADRNANILESLKQLVSKFIINIHVELRKVSHTKQRFGLLRSLNSANDRILVSIENVERGKLRGLKVGKAFKELSIVA